MNSAVIQAFAALIHNIVSLRPAAGRLDELVVHRVTQYQVQVVLESLKLRLSELSITVGPALFDIL